ncbi:hypothetical protein PAXRUDRAFT_824292 [Paxillus rubicundulus Ve08.2h10]|uniref:Uncharacterized protein n=1 Tax=Paxillus rubicundulus Ve08.2h10 TaxID=930991 RepID=A0A0D0E280_9AGAM|nr:hypothetical protein PAXRUDRAFT_824292 [Paxillus rubicundulus Ve08.2h10]
MTYLDHEVSQNHHVNSVSILVTYQTFLFYSRQAYASVNLGCDRLDSASMTPALSAW